MDIEVRDELLDLIEVKEVGVVYIMGYFYVKVRKFSSFMKKFVIDIGYSFFRKNCCGFVVVFYIFYISFIEVGMIYYV